VIINKFTTNKSTTGLHG